MKKKAYSYIRFSTHQQSFKSSLERQEASIQQWIKQNPDFELADCSYRDLGISGYTGKHIDDGGMLGKFLEGCNQGLIQKGSVLLVESMDRLGRLRAEVMLEIVTSLIKQVTIITLDDDQSYSIEDINGPKVFLLIAKIHGAHSYSQQLAERLLKGKSVSREKVKAGTQKKYVSTCPSWLEWSEKHNRFIEIPSRVEVVKLIFELYIKHDLGTTAIASKLNSEKIDDFNGKGWHGSYIQKILFTKKVLGTIEFQQRNNNGDYCEGYYPQVIDDETFMKAQLIKQSKSKKFRTSNTAIQPPKDIFVNIVKCVCGEEAKLYNKGNSNRVYICKNRKRGLCKESSQLSNKFLLLHFCQFIESKFYQFSSLELKKSQGKSQDLSLSKAEKLEELNSQIAQTLKKLEFYTEQIFDASDEDEQATLTLKRSNIRQALDNLKFRRVELESKVRIDEMLEVVSVGDLEAYRQYWSNYYNDHVVEPDPLKLSALNQFLESQNICIYLHKDQAVLKHRDELLLTVSYLSRSHGVTISTTPDNRIFLSTKGAAGIVPQYGRVFDGHSRTKGSHSGLADTYQLDGVFYPVQTNIFKK